MSLMNYDRHGMENLKHDHVKPFDRIKIPPVIIYGILCCFVLILLAKMLEDQEQTSEKLTRRSLLLAMRKSQQKAMRYDADTEISPAEQVEMQSMQYHQVVTQ